MPRNPSTHVREHARYKITIPEQPTEARQFPAAQAKAYTTRVGAGPYPTEIFGDLGEDIRRIGAEYGTTTGRPRRVGWLDIPALKYATRCAADPLLSKLYFQLFQG